MMSPRTSLAEARLSQFGKSSAFQTRSSALRANGTSSGATSLSRISLGTSPAFSGLSLARDLIVPFSGTQPGSTSSQTIKGSCPTHTGVTFQSGIESSNLKGSRPTHTGVTFEGVVSANQKGSRPTHTGVTFQSGVVSSNEKGSRPVHTGVTGKIPYSSKYGAQSGSLSRTRCFLRRFMVAVGGAALLIQSVSAWQCYNYGVKCRSKGGMFTGSEWTSCRRRQCPRRICKEPTCRAKIGRVKVCMDCAKDYAEDHHKPLESGDPLYQRLAGDEDRAVRAKKDWVVSKNVRPHLYKFYKSEVGWVCTVDAKTYEVITSNHFLAASGYEGYTVQSLPDRGRKPAVTMVYDTVDDRWVNVKCTATKYATDRYSEKDCGQVKGSIGNTMDCTQILFRDKADNNLRKLTCPHVEHHCRRRLACTRRPSSRLLEILSKV